MNILFLGNFEPPYSSENYYMRTLVDDMRINVINVQENKATVGQMQDIILTQERNGYPIDLFFWVHTHGWVTLGMPEFLSWLREKGIISFAYHLDLYMGLSREPDLYNDPFFTVDHFFTVDKLMADWLNANTKCKGHFLPAGVYEGECFLGTPDHEKYPHEIVFTGSKGYHHEYPYRPKLIDWLHETYGERFGHYGGGGLPTVRGPELNNLYASAKVVVGDTLCKDFKYPWYSSDRLFECAGRGAALIYPDIHGLKTFYDESEVFYYQLGDFDSLKILIDTIIEDSEFQINVRDAMRENALARTLKEHTYRHRMEHILKTIKPQIV